MPSFAEGVSLVLNNPIVKQKWSKIRDAPRLINVLVHLKHEHLQRDVQRVRADIDGPNKTSFFRFASETHNNETIMELLRNLEIGNNMFADFQFYLKCELNEGAFKLKHAELRKYIEKALIDFRASGQGENALGFSDDEHSISSMASTEDNPIGVSMEHSLKTHSTEFFAFVKEDPVLFYFYTCFIKNDMLESCSSDMPEECSGNSSTVKNASYSAPIAVKPKGKEKEESDMVASARVLADAFRGAFSGEDMPDEHSGGKKRPNSEMELDDVMKRLNEATKAKDDMGIIDPVVIALNKAYCDKLV